MEITKHGKNYGTTQGIPLGQTAKIVVLVKHWPSLGITEDAPLLGLEVRYNGSGKTLVQGKNRKALAAWFKKNDPYGSLR